MKIKDFHFNCNAIQKKEVSNKFTLTHIFSRSKKKAATIE